jgi:SAM-dependent methyltransferase
MDLTAFELKEKIRQQFDFGPYPRKPLESTPKDNFNELFIHCFATPFYLKNQATIATHNLTILDVGCGTGYTSLKLALANPGAKIVGVDISGTSIELAKQRLTHHNIENFEFQVLSALELSKLEMQFDYINCDEVLYLLDLPKALRAMQSVLKPHGFIRSNLHSALQRAPYFRSQELFHKMGLMDSNPEELEIETVKSIFLSLKETVDLKRVAWSDSVASDHEAILMNYLFQGDRGYRVADLFRALEAADLEFLSMTNWAEWDLLKLFKDPDDLPLPLAIGLSEATIEDRLHVVELLHPVHRLLDFWCGHPDTIEFHPVIDWTVEEWQNATVSLHPILKTDTLKEHLLDCIDHLAPLVLTQFLNKTTGELELRIDSILASVLLPLWDGQQPFQKLIDRYLQVRPVHAGSLEPIGETVAFEAVKNLLMSLETYMYVFVEKS